MCPPLLCPRLFWLLAVAPALLGAQALPRTRPELVGMSSARLARLARVLQADVDSGHIAGAVAIVLRRGRVVALDTVGWADRDARVPMRSNTIFRIASMSKAITSVGAMMLVEEGKLLLDDPVSKFLPEFRDQRVLAALGDSAKGTRDSLVPATRPITVHDLLTHRSGITYVFMDGTSNVGYYRRAGIADGIGGGEGAISAMVEKIAAQPLAFQPGTKWMYGLNTDVLGRLIEVVSGLPFDRFLGERVLRPLGMNDTYFYVPDDKAARIAVPYTVDSAGRLRVMDTVQRVGASCSPAGAVVAPVRTSRAAPGFTRLLRTTLASSRCCSTAASSTVCASCPRRRWS
jgi:CubicO group peptidase (beta-lactamase class C family)